ncbi:MAG: anti-sigma factor RsbA family regulatory protein [Actinoallomurus sp.]
MSVPSPGSRFVHRFGVYRSDQDFVDMAGTYISEGLEQDMPVLVVTTAANLHLIGKALGASAAGVDYAETAYLGRRPIQRLGALHRYWKRHAQAGHDRVRVLMEPNWAGLSPQQVNQLKRMESAFNLTLAPFGIDELCPYDARTIDPAVIADAYRTHPKSLHNGHTQTSTDFEDPHAFIRECDADPLRPSPTDAAVLRTEGDPRELRRFAARQAAAQGVPDNRATMLALATGEAANYLTNDQRSPATARIWTEFGALVCELHAPDVRISDPVVGLRPLEGVRDIQAGVWLARQICDRLEIRSDESGTTIRLYVPEARAEEFLRTDFPYAF